MKKCKVLIKGIYHEVYEEEWKVEDSDYEKFFNEKEGVIYSIYHFKNGEKQYSFVTKRFWDHLEEIGEIASNPKLTSEEQKNAINEILEKDDK